MPGLKLQILEEKNLDNIYFIPIFIGPFLKIAFFAPLRMQTLESNKTSSSTKAKSGHVQAFFGPSTGTVQDNGEKVFAAGNRSDSHSFFSAHPRPVVQPKLTINEPGDQYEQEADAMAERVMRMTSAPPGGDGEPMPAGASSVPFLQRKCAACGEEEKIQRAEMEEEEPLQRKELTAGSFGGSEPIVIQRKCTACEEEEKVQRQEMEEEEPVQTKPLMRKAAGGGYTATPRLQSQLDSSKGGGNPLPGPTLTSMNQAFGADFSQVRIHTDGRAAEMSQGIQAKAFTHGADIYFNRGQYSPESGEGRRLLGHELVHVVQQGSAGMRIQNDYWNNPQSIQRQPSDESKTLQKSPSHEDYAQLPSKLCSELITEMYMGLYRIFSYVPSVGETHRLPFRKNQALLIFEEIRSLKRLLKIFKNCSVLVPGMVEEQTTILIALESLAHPRGGDVDSGLKSLRNIYEEYAIYDERLPADMTKVIPKLLEIGKSIKKIRNTHSSHGRNPLDQYHRNPAL